LGLLFFVDHSCGRLSAKVTAFYPQRNTVTLALGALAGSVPGSIVEPWIAASDSSMSL